MRPRDARARVVPLACGQRSCGNQAVVQADLQRDCHQASWRFLKVARVEPRAVVVRFRRGAVLARGGHPTALLLADSATRTLELRRCATDAILPAGAKIRGRHASRCDIQHWSREKHDHWTAGSVARSSARVDRIQSVIARSCLFTRAFTFTLRVCGPDAKKRTPGPEAFLVNLALLLNTDG
eukprot:scaffold42954_cov74-Phaeocystis_antarctica.AAC.7